MDEELLRRLDVFAQRFGTWILEQNENIQFSSAMSFAGSFADLMDYREKFPKTEFEIETRTFISGENGFLHIVDTKQKP